MIQTRGDEYRETIKKENEKLSSLQKTLSTIINKLRDDRALEKKVYDKIKELHDQEIDNNKIIKELNEITIPNQLKTIEELKKNVTENDETILKIKQQTTELNETLKLNDEIQQKIQTTLIPRPTKTGGHPERFSSKGFMDINFDEIINNSTMSTHIDDLKSSFNPAEPSTSIYTL